MIITIQINTENDSFQGQESFETARILKTLTNQIESHPHFSQGLDMPLFDANGNEAGYFTIRS